MVPIFASTRGRGGRNDREQEVLEINWLYENQGSKTSFICSNHNPLNLHFVLCLSNQTFPEENLILLGPVCSQSTSHMAYFNKSPLLPMALVSEPSPKGSPDGSFNLLSNQSWELADLALLGWARGAACLVASVSLSPGKPQQHTTSFFKSFLPDPWKGQEESVKTEAGPG